MICQRNPKILLFDMDGVITHTMPVHYRIWRQIFAEQGIPVTRLDIYKREGQKGIDSVREIFQEYNRPFSLEFARELLAEKERRFQESVQVRFVPGARRFLRWASRRWKALGLVTGTSREELDRILPPPWRDLFATLVTGDRVSQGKPSPEPYCTALKELHCSPENALVIENAPLGIQSAKAAGLSVVALTTSLPADYLRAADKVFDRFQELKDFLEKGEGAS